jgi:hypothetical protein
MIGWRDGTDRLLAAVRATVASEPGYIETHRVGTHVGYAVVHMSKSRTRPAVPK